MKTFEEYMNENYSGQFDMPHQSETYKAGQESRQSEIDELKAKLAKVESGEWAIVPKEPSIEMWSEIPRQLGRYMQMHDRYRPKTLKKHFDRFIGEIPEWLNKEVNNWDYECAFATADLPVFIYKAMIEAAQEK